MKKITTTLALMLVSILSHAQVFMGIPISGPITEFSTKIKAKGFTIKPAESTPTMLMFKGTMGGKDVEVAVVCTPTSKLTKKVVVFYPIETTWYSLKSEYDEIAQIITNKYGASDEQYNFFSSPYEEGDGYEMTAIAVEKCYWMAVWKNNSQYPNQTLAVRITKSKRVTLAYENNELMEQSDVEQEKIDANNY